MPNAKTLVALAIVWAAATPTSAGEDEPFALAISSVTPSFRADSLGPEFIVSFMNIGANPIQVAALAKTVFIEMGGVRYDRGAILSHSLPPEIAPGATGEESVASAPVTFKILKKK